MMAGLEYPSLKKKSSAEDQATIFYLGLVSRGLRRKWGAFSKSPWAGRF